MIKPPRNIQFIGNEVAILWPNGREDFFKMEELRACSPSAENMGERDLKWTNFTTDPEWLQKKAETEKDGAIVASVENAFLRPTAFSAVK